MISSDSPTEKIAGTIHHKSLEGGFWGIVVSDGRRLVPVNPIPSRLQREGTRIEAEIKAAHVLGAVQWGTPVEVMSIDLAS